jgi:hypothetical protein
MKTHGGVEDMVLHIINLNTGWSEWSAFVLGEDPAVPIGYEAG